MRKFYLIILVFGLYLGFESSLLAGVITDIISAKANPNAVSVTNLSSFLKESREKNAEPKFVEKVLSETKKLQDKQVPAEPYLLKATEALAKGVSPKTALPVLKRTQESIELASGLSDQLLAGRSPTEAAQLRPRLFNHLHSTLQQGVPALQLSQMAREFAVKGKGWTLSQLLASLAGLRSKALILPHQAIEIPNLYYPQGKVKVYAPKYKYKDYEGNDYKYKVKRNGPPDHAPAHGYRNKRR